MPVWGWPVAALFSTLVGTGLARHYALRRRLLDPPGERRNHSVPTPRGGGIAILLTMLAGVVGLTLVMPRSAWVPGMVGVSLLLVGGIGWVDDHRPLPAWLRLATHAVAVVCLAVGGWMAGWPLWLCLASALLALVLINFWNFMDGIDGIAASQAALVAAAIALASPAGWWLGFDLLLIGASLGFLAWNFPKARIFMGDVGSGLLGLALAWGWAAASAHESRNALVLLLPMGPFLVDASLTLLRRMLRRERWWEGHSTHTYQVWARRGGSHVKVTLGYAGLSLLGLLLSWGLRPQGLRFIFLAVIAWYIGLAIMWWVGRRPAMDRPDRSGG